MGEGNIKILIHNLNMAKARLHIEVYGIVQGVFFRSNPQKKAFSLGL